MPDHTASDRTEQFRAQPLQWLTVHHLLDAVSLRELLSVIVSESSLGRLTIDDLLEEALPIGDRATTDWMIATRASTGSLEFFLTRLILMVVWQGDELPFATSDDLDADGAAWIEGILAALNLGISDFGSDMMFKHGDRAASLEPFTAMMHECRLVVLGDDDAVEPERIDRAVHDAPPLLAALFIKHLGDLFGDADRWDLARGLYLLAESRLDRIAEPDAADNSALSIINQSSAMATWHLDGPEAVARQLGELIPRSLKSASLLPSLNASLDLMNAQSAHGLLFSDLDDRRSAICDAPLLLQSHSLEHAMGYAAIGRFREAHRWFWAKLRRQSALGGITVSCQTKGHYGRAVIAELETSIGRELMPDAFSMGVRLLVESGHAEISGVTSWSSRLLETYLSPTILADVRACVSRNPGVSTAREVVATTLRRDWLLTIQRDRTDLAQDMLDDLMASARRGRHSGVANMNTAGVALKALKMVATDRPEFRTLVGVELVELVESLQMRSGPVPFSDALNVAALFIDGVGRDTAEALAWRATEIAKGLPLNAFWPITQAVSLLLASEAAYSFAKRDDVFRTALAIAKIEIALNSPLEYSSLLYAMRDVDPALAREQIDVDALDRIVDGIRERARNISSSGAAGEMHALLVAPRVSGPAGIADAIDALRKMLRSAADDRLSPSLPNGAQVLLLLARTGDAIAEDMGVEFDLRAKALDLIEPLREMWTIAATRPLIFAGFAIPPRTAPDLVTVHNWTFATLQFLRFLNADGELDEALAAAAANDLLAEGMATAAAVHVIGSEPLAVDAVAHERPEAFYAALGERLVAIGPRDDPEANRSLRLLLDRCMEIGPRGEDAALFLAAHRQRLRLDPEAEAVVAYTAKLRRSATLRLSLSPLLRSVVDDSTRLET